MLSSTARICFALTAILLFGAPETHAQTQEPPYNVRQNYVKQEVMIPMRDGVKLFTIIYTPRAQTEKYPILLTRTAYGVAPYGADNYRATVGPNNMFAKEGYIVAYQDSRGKFRSEGEFIHHRPIVKGQVNEVTDTYDTIDWLVKNVANNNGRVGQWGISWGGWEVSEGMIDAHPALKASSPQSPPQDQFLGDDHHSGGAFQLMYAFQWMSTNARARGAPSDAPVGRFDYGTPDGWDFFLRLGAAANARQFFADDVPTWNDYMIHGTYDEYWQSRNVPKDLKGINHPVLLVGTWFDAQDFWGPFRMYDAMIRNNPNNKTHFIVGPWLHGGYARESGASLGDISFGSNTGNFFREQVELPFFNFYLKDKGTLNLPNVQVFETGKNTWRSFDKWPPSNTKATRIYPSANNTLSFSAPKSATVETYISDPAKPVPYSAQPGTIEGHTFMVEDQRFAWTRPDVLYYQTEPLTEDITIAGSITAHMNVSTTGTDADFVVKLIDVYPGKTTETAAPPSRTAMGGFQMMLAADILRTKFRNSFSKPQPMIPNAPTQIQIPLGDKYHTFLKGHRIMVQVQSSWFPMFDRNPQKFVDIYHAKASDYQKATHKVFLGGAKPSYVEFSVLRP